MTPTSANTISSRRFLRPIVLVPVALAFLAFATFVLLYFEPQTAFINRTINEAAPITAPITTSTAAVNTASSTTPTTVASETVSINRSGQFFSLAHSTSGTAQIIAAADGSIILRLESFKVDNGPDLRVILSSASGKDGDFSITYLELADLKANRGDQNYVIPPGTDLSKYNSVAIWCRRFDSTFGAADLK